MVELTVRLVLSLSLVLGLLALLARFGGRRFRGKGDAMVRILHRQHLSRSATVSVVAVGTRVLVLGTTDQQVRVLAELDPDEVVEGGETLALVRDGQPGAPAAARPNPRPRAGARRADGPLTGSVLSVDTWRQALTAATRRTS